MKTSLCGYKGKYEVIVGTVFIRLFPLFVFLLFHTANIFAQTKMSADVVVRQLYKNKLIKIQKQIFFTFNGNLVVHYTYPQEYYMITNSLGETSVYQPSVNEVMYITDKTLSSQTEIFSLFMTPNFSDLNLTNLGFVLKGTKKEGTNIVKIFTPTQSIDKNIKQVKVVCKKDQPIYSAFYSKDNRITKKTYYTDYIVFPNISFPTVITQISYDSKGDSVINKEEFKNIKTSNFPVSSCFNYKIPKGAKRVSPYSVKK